MDKITSLVEARKRFSTQGSCEEYMTQMRWPNGVTCPRCGSHGVTYMESRHQWQCVCRYQFSVTSGTVFHKTHIDLPRWLMAVWLVCHSPKGISSAQIQRELGVTYKTAWYMTRRIRLAIQNNLVGMRIEGDVEMDDAVVKADGGRASGNVSENCRNVLGVASRDHGTLRMFVIHSLREFDVESITSANLGRVKTIYTDGAQRFAYLSRIGLHRTVTHYTTYADGEAHVNHVENAWSLFKRALVGVYHHVSAKYLQDYLDEFAFRASNRKDKDAMVSLVLASC